MRTPASFKSIIKITNAKAFHAELRAVFVEECNYHSKGEAIPNQAGQFWDSDFFSVSNSVKWDPNIESQIDWLTETLRVQRELFLRIKSNGGAIEFSIMCASDSRRGNRVVFSEDHLKRIASSEVSLELITLAINPGGMSV